MDLIVIEREYYLVENDCRLYKWEFDSLTAGRVYVCDHINAVWVRVGEMSTSFMTMRSAVRWLDHNVVVVIHKKK